MKGIQTPSGHIWSVFATLSDSPKSPGLICIPPDDLDALSNEGVGRNARSMVRPCRAHFAHFQASFYDNRVDDESLFSEESLKEPQDEIALLEFLSDFAGESPAIDRTIGRLQRFAERARVVTDTERRAEVRKRMAENYHEYFQALGERDGYECAKCGTTKDLEIDHIKPISFGGDNRKQNLQILCRGCNASKGDDEVDFRS